VLLGERERQRALAGRRGSENRDDEWSGHRSRLTTYTMNANIRRRRPSCCGRVIVVRIRAGLRCSRR